MIRRDRPDDRPCKCGAITATLGASTAIHAASMLCTQCGRFNGWLSDMTTDAVLSDAAVGANQPISLNSIEDEIIMALDASQSSSDDMKGALFANKHKQEGDNRPSYTGKAKIFGREVQISGWPKVAKSGAKYMSIAFKAGVTVASS
jgi:hypothetical protein